MAAAGALSLGALFGYQQVIGDSGQGPRVVSPQASLAYPMETARDGVSYGDYVVVLHVKEGSEKVGDIPSDARSRGEGPLTRSGRIIIDKLLHSRKGAKDLPASFTAPLTGYWWDEDTGRQKFAFTGMPRVETGHHHIAVLVWDEDLHGFGIVNHGGVLPYDHGTVGVGEWEGSTHTEPLPDNRLTGVAKRVNGGHLADLQRVLHHA